MAFRIQLRRDTSDKWTVNNPILLSGEIGYETNTRYIKIGDGTTYWNDLEYWNDGVLPQDFDILKNGSSGLTGATGINFVGDNQVTYDGKVANINLLGNSSPVYKVTVNLDNGDFASFSSSSGPDGQPLTGSNWNFTLNNNGNNVTVVHNKGSVPFGLSVHGNDSSEIFVNYPSGTTGGSFSLSYPISKNNFTVYNINSINTGASPSGTVDVIWSFGSTF
jgi:hypothetical protein